MQAIRFRSKHCLLLLVVGMFMMNQSFAQTAQTSNTYTFDWRTQKPLNAQQRLPFDVGFDVVLTNVDSNFKKIELDLRESDGIRRAKRDTKTLTLDEHFKSSTEIITVPGISLGNNSFIFHIPEEFGLKPNHAYLLGFTVRVARTLTYEEKTEVERVLKASESLKKRIKNEIVYPNPYKINTQQLANLIEPYLAEINANSGGSKKYEVELKALSDQQASLVQALAEVAADMMNVGAVISPLLADFSKDYKLKESDVKLLSDLVEPYPVRGGFRLKDAITAQGVATVIDTLKSTALRQAKADGKTDAQIAAIKSDIETKRDLVKSDLNKTTQHADAAIDAIIKQIVTTSLVLFVEAGSTQSDDIGTNARTYISQSVGGVISPGTDKLMTTLTYSVFFRPVNHQVALAKYKGADFWKTRLCMNFGITLNAMSTNKTGDVVSGIVGDKAVIFGAGFRLLSFLKFDMNSMIYNKSDANPTTPNTRLKFSPVIGFSLNLNVAKLLAGEANPMSELTNFFRN